MRNKDFTLAVLQHLREGKTEKEIALLTQRHRNTISNHVRWLRQHFAIEPQLLTNQTLQKIQQRLNDMTDRDLIHFLSVLMPQHIEAISHSIVENIEEKRDVTIVANYTTAIEDAVNRDIEALRARKQVDTAQINPETS